MSGQLLWLKDGAALNLLLSPLNTNVGCSMLLVALVELLGVLLLAIPELDGRSRVQGTGTSFSLVVVVVVVPLVALVLVLLVSVLAAALS